MFALVSSLEKELYIGGLCLFPTSCTNILSAWDFDFYERLKARRASWPRPFSLKRIPRSPILCRGPFIYLLSLLLLPLWLPTSFSPPSFSHIASVCCPSSLPIIHHFDVLLSLFGCFTLFPKWMVHSNALHSELLREIFLGISHLLAS